MKQYVYVMSCPSLPHMVKIGFSVDCKSRANGLSSSGCPLPFRVRKKWLVDNARNLEKTVHRYLSFCRISTNREFFGISVEKAVDAINTIIETGSYENEDFNKFKSIKVENCKSIGKFIRQERKRQGLTQKQIAFTCGTGLRIIGEIESGKSTAQIDKVFEILKILRIDIFALPKST